MKKILLLLAILSMAAVYANAQNPGISGKVTDSATEKGLAYVYVQVKSSLTDRVFAGLTDQNGDFSIKALSEGKYILSVNILGYSPSSQEVVAGGSDGLLSG